MHQILESLLDDHTSMRRVFDLFARELAVFAEGGTPDYDILAGALDYLRDYLDAVHHPLEDRMAEQLKRRAPTFAASLEALDQVHRELEALTNETAHEFAAVRDDAVAARAGLCDRGRNLLETYHDHLSWEEARLFPLAQRALTEADWDAALGEDGTQLDLAHVQQVKDRFAVWLRQYVSASSS